MSGSAGKRTRRGRTEVPTDSERRSSSDSASGAQSGVSVLGRLLDLPAGHLSHPQLKRLEEHRYSSAGRSLLEPSMQPYWEGLVARVPTWIAPNLITIVGLATNILTTLVLVYYCPTATEQVCMIYMG